MVMTFPAVIFQFDWTPFFFFVNVWCGCEGSLKISCCEKRQCSEEEEATQSKCNSDRIRREFLLHTEVLMREEKKKKICGKMRSYLVQKWTFEKLNPGEDFQSAECRVDCFFVCDVAETSSTNRPPQSLWLHGSACAAGMRREGQPVQAVQHMTTAATVRRWREHGWGGTLIQTGGRRSEARGGSDKVVQKKKTTLAEHS